MRRAFQTPHKLIKDLEKTLLSHEFYKRKKNCGDELGWVKILISTLNSGSNLPNPTQDTLLSKI